MAMGTLRVSGLEEIKDNIDSALAELFDYEFDGDYDSFAAWREGLANRLEDLQDDIVDEINYFTNGEE